MSDSLRWVTNGNEYRRPSRVTKSLLPGIYSCDADNHGVYLIRTEQVSDGLIVVPDGPSHAILEEIQKFWTLQPAFRKRGLLFKRGVLVYGPPGGGKTVMIRQLMDMVVKADGIAVLLSPNCSLSVACLKMLRAQEPDRFVVAIIEDFEEVIDDNESGWLSLLDGEFQIDNVVYVATTNYVKELPARFTNRPSRLNVVQFVGMPSPAARRLYLLSKEPSLKKNDEIDAWVTASEGFSFAHLREMIILCRCYKHPLEYAVKRLEAMRFTQEEAAQTPETAETTTATHPVGAAVEASSRSGIAWGLKPSSIAVITAKPTRA